MEKCRKMGMKNEYINRVGRSRKSPQTSPPQVEIKEPYKSIIEGIMLGWDGMQQIQEPYNVSIISLDISYIKQ